MQRDNMQLEIGTPEQGIRCFHDDKIARPFRSSRFNGSQHYQMRIILIPERRIARISDCSINISAAMHPVGVFKAMSCDNSLLITL